MTFDDQIVARTIWAEARGEPEEGQRAVAQVMVNRRKDGRWGRSYAAVCLAARQFSCWNTTDNNRMSMVMLPEGAPLLAKFLEFVREAESEAVSDPTLGALHYYNPKIAAPDWAVGKPFTKIGNHHFVTEVR